MQRVVAVRHGETEWSRSGRHTSRTDLDLTDAGRVAAAALAPVLAGFDFELVLTSPMHRAAETARLAGCTNFVVDENLREWDYGEYEGRTTADIRDAVPGWRIFSHGAPGGETIEEIATRMDRVIARVRAVPGDVAVFSHGHALRVLGARWCELPPVVGQNLLVDPASVSVLTYERQIPALGHWNWSPAPH